MGLSAYISGPGHQPGLVNLDSACRHVRESGEILHVHAEPPACSTTPGPVAADLCPPGEVERLRTERDELLASCRELLGYVESEYGHDSYPDDELDPKASGHEGVVARARLAIAKAAPPPSGRPGPAGGDEEE